MRGKILYYNPKKWIKFRQNDVEMQTPTVPNFEISIFGKFGFPKNNKSAPQNMKFDFDFEFLGQKFDFESPKSVSLIPLESHFGTQKFEISDLENL